MKYLIVGLGNIGAEYAGTRHNIGFKVLDALAEASNAVFTTARYGDVAELKHKGRTLILLKPSTYMNLSGKAVRYWMEAEKIAPENLLVVSDDIALPGISPRATRSTMCWGSGRTRSARRCPSGSRCSATRYFRSRRSGWNAR